MRINAKMVMLVGIGLVILFTILGAQVAGDGHDQGTGSPDRQSLEAGGNINESDSGTWLAEYESDGVKAPGGVPATHLPPGKAVLAALLLILTGILAVGTEMRRSNQTEQTVNDP